MDAATYQGLFYLTLGGASFTLLTLSLRLLSLGQAQRVLGQEHASISAWERKEELEIVAIADECAAVKSFRFRRINGKPFPRFLPGQFLSFQIGDDPKVTRSYSLCSSASVCDTAVVAIKELSSGVGSSWFHQRRIGDRVWAYPFAGHFTSAMAGTAPRVYVAGGIGITPFVSMVRSQIERGDSYPTALFYGMRTHDEMAFHAELLTAASRHSWFTYVPVLSAPDGSRPWNGEKGFVSLELIQSRVELDHRTQFFFCGPDAMTGGLMQKLKAVGVVDERLHLEKFVSPVVLEAADIPERAVEIEYLGQKFAYTGRRTLLEFFESQGLELPYSCRTGVCGTCKCKLDSGKVVMLTEAGLNADEKRQGQILTCVAYPETNLNLSP